MKAEGKELRRCLDEKDRKYQEKYRELESMTEKLNEANKKLSEATEQLLQEEKEAQRWKEKFYTIDDECDDACETIKELRATIAVLETTPGASTTAMTQTTIVPTIAMEISRPPSPKKSLAERIAPPSLLERLNHSSSGGGEDLYSHSIAGKDHFGEPRVFLETIGAVRGSTPLYYLTPKFLIHRIFNITDVEDLLDRQAFEDNPQADNARLILTRLHEESASVRDHIRNPLQVYVLENFRTEELVTERP
ncbi:hypothetical protein EUX98_g8140 [Antrodiella citrinella]|uniref:Uncharacterized protein n=1 Tax=Antrodiella citrinella TaxID=2447956 RepID=A0A4S4MDU6_9APHY|nr:hypothetical protein EUX98_g8140 [Antrodiella citrinella]